MESSNLIEERYSVRAYKPDSVEEEKLQQVLDAERLAPAACNLQAFQIIVIHTHGREAELDRIYRQSWSATSTGRRLPAVG
jgi:nitroreductase